MISGVLHPVTNLNRATKLNIATPAYRGEYSSAYVRSLYALLTAGPAMGLRFCFSEIDYSDIVVSRNYLASNFVYNMKDSSHLLFLDADMGFPHRLIGEMVALDEDIVGVVYPKRSIDLQKLHALHGCPFAKAYAESCSFVGTPGIPHPLNPAFRRVESCGTGILLISRHCFEKMIEICPDVVDALRYKQHDFAAKFSNFINPFSKIVLADRELSEDLSFCRRWVRNCEGSIYANVTYDIEHVGALTVKTSHADLL